MKIIRLLLILMTVGCASIKPQVYKISDIPLELPIKTVAIEEIRVWKFIERPAEEIKEEIKKDGRPNLEKFKVIELKNEDAQEFISVFKETFSRVLKEKGIEVVQGKSESLPHLTIKVNMFYKVMGSIPLPVRVLAGNLLIYSGENLLDEIQYAGQWGVIPPISYGARKFSEGMAESVASRFGGK